MGILGKLFGKGLSDVTASIGGVIDSLSTSDKEKLEAKAKLTEIVTGKLAELASYQKEVLVTELKGNFLQKSWRPIIMLAFGTIVIVACFYNVKLNKVPEEFWGLLKIGIGGYIGGRSLEKITGKVTENIDMPFLKKKHRK